MIEFIASRKKDVTNPIETRKTKDVKSLRTCENSCFLTECFTNSRRFDRAIFIFIEKLLQPKNILFVFFSYAKFYSSCIVLFVCVKVSKQSTNNHRNDHLIMWANPRKSSFFSPKGSCLEKKNYAVTVCVFGFLRKTIHNFFCVSREFFST